MRVTDITTARAHYDGNKIVLDEPLDLEPDAKLIVTVLPDQLADTVDERTDWQHLAMISIGRAYGDDEPEYTMDMIKEKNPDYEGE